MPTGSFNFGDETYTFDYPEGEDPKKYAKKAYQKLKEREEGTYGDRFRELVAGLTFEFGDEIEAGIKTGFGTNGDYTAKRDEIRAEMEQFRDNNRGEALAWNIAGSLPTALIPGLGMAKAAQGAKLASRIGQGALVGAGEGSLAGLGASDSDSLGGMALDTGVGLAAGAGIGGSLGGLLAGKINRGIQSGVNKVENMPSNAVQGELKEVLDTLNMTPEEIVKHVESGKLIAEIPTIAPYINAAMGNGKSARQMVYDLYEPAGIGAKGRGDILADEARDNVFKTLTKSGDRNQIEAQIARAAEMEEGVGPVYQSARQTEITDQSFIDQMVDLYRRFPEAREQLEKLAQENNIVPAFREGVDGAITPNRVPNVGDADQLMRFLRELKGNRYRAGEGELGKSAGDAYSALRRDLDNLAPDLADARRQVRSAKTMEQGFKDFNKAPGGNIDPKESAIAAQERMLKRSGESEMMSNYMEGAQAATSMQIANALRNMSTGGVETIKKLLSDSTNQGMLLRMVSEGKDIGPLLQKLDNAADARSAQQALLRGSKTSSVQMAQKKLGTNVNAEEALNAMAGSPAAMINLANKLSSRLERRVKPEEIDEVMKVLLNPNPEAVKRVLVGSDEKAKVSREILNIVQQVLMAAPAKAGQDAFTAAQLEYN